MNSNLYYNWFKAVVFSNGTYSDVPEDDVTSFSILFYV